ncbi:hypothetical protein Q1695_012048 [Nippostrongylus brasiliensis]|nr:hypothetical protein Q1695_012048 [Nippostrongylus brasiliensis]
MWMKILKIDRFPILGPFRTFRLKTLLEESVRLFPAGCDHGLEGVVDYHILANGGFAQTTWMQRSFGQPEVANDMLKAHFNECFSSSFDAYLSSLDAQQFHEYTRLLPGEFMELQSRVAHRLQHVPTHSAPVSAMHRFALTLRYLGHGMSFVATAHELGLGKNTVRKYIDHYPQH